MQGKSNFLRPGRARTNAQHLLGKTVNVGSECGGLKRRSLSSGAASGDPIALMTAAVQKIS
jgi:hypothetical protein